MGVGKSKLSAAELEEYAELTYFTKKEVVNIYTRFKDLVDPAAWDQAAHFHDIRVPISEVVVKLSEMRVNPFAARLCSVFANPRYQGIAFEEFLDMMSVLSEMAPAEVKAEWAFRVFDFDGDSLLGKSDIANVVQAITTKPAELNLELNEGYGSRRTSAVEDGDTGGQLTTEQLDKIVTNVLNEADLDKTGVVSILEFKHIVTKSPDFAQSFRMRL